MGFPEGYCVAVTGAASGIGRATALLLAGQGVRVACLDHADPAETAASAGGGAAAHLLDIADAAACRAILGKVIADFGRLDGLVNCAGVVGPTNIRSEALDPADFEAVCRVNLFGALHVSQAVLPHMRGRGYGRILHVASIAGKEGNAGMAAYSASKAGLIGLVKSMGKEYAETGVTVNALAPAVIRTPMVAAMPEAQVAYMTDRIPMKRCGELDEAARMIAWIVGPDCSFTTGFTFDLSGGRAVY
ncbi:MAG TPA: SDR family oxidoreductase [Amaricoccus sp.]|uniref:SDR family NAD(P)-dependent oxidoreductase n=1 Tax=Amaricoccus sp. TaxID=1872485 RepID=UPI002CFCE420|nr:SDR family NAD(P)-dependent oxidoreductase [Amaricoccus sp.]HMQ91605.1 SDR family oxidoreductase [Amaricoccus sp.]HMR51139.1 SDR family oxidoreductase [Amaricoccus sp.]HMR59183.1 SDR family oxidoreductase [Amaricoccus sp.]HMT98113.1 SDR family oxidoreductase [Amaricoccus sp.]